MSDLIGAFLFWLSLVCVRHQCRDGWHVEGVRPSGITRCVPSPPPGCGEPAGPNRAPCPRDDRWEPAGIYCTGGSRPIIVDYRTVGCTR